MPSRAACVDDCASTRCRRGCRKRRASRRWAVWPARRGRHEGCDPGAQRRGAGRRRPLPRHGAAHVRDEADPGRAPHADQPRGAHTLFRNAAWPHRRPLWVRRRAYRYRAARSVRRRPPVPYDLLSLNIGSTPNTVDVPGASEHAIPVKPIDGFLRRFEALQSRVLARKGRTALALVGAGAGGVELLLAVEHRFRQAVTRAGFDAAGLSFVLISDVADILPSFPAAFRARFHAVLAARGIAVITGAPVTRVEAGRLMLAGHGPVAADEILWTTQAAPARWLAKAELPLDARGFLRVDETLRVAGHENVFAAGDTIAFSGRDLPKSGVYAVRAGPALADNIRRALTGRPLRRFRPQRQALYLVSTGARHAVGARNGLVVEGAWVWRW